MRASVPPEGADTRAHEAACFAATHGRRLVIRRGITGPQLLLVESPDLIDCVVDFVLQKNVAQRCRGFGWIAIHTCCRGARAGARRQLVRPDPTMLSVESHELRRVV